jgi:uncharacterized protein YegP (UPF0339 family)
MSEPESNVVKLTFFRGEDGQWYWNGKAANGEIVATGEGHTRREDAVRAAQGVFPEVGIYINEDSVA